MLVSSLDRKRLSYAIPVTVLLVFGLVVCFTPAWLKTGSHGTTPLVSGNDSTVTNSTISTLLNPIPTPSAFEGNEPPPWIILLTVNNGFFDFFENWMAHYNRLGVAQRDEVGIVIVAYDDVVLEKIRYYENLPPRTIVVSSEASVHTSNSTDFTYGSFEFKKLMANRANIILGQLYKGSSVILIDLDIVLLKDPFPYLIEPIDRGEYDMLIQFDRDWQHSPKAARLAHRDTYCAGLFAAAHNPRILSFMEDWQHELSKQPTMNQRIYNELLERNVHNITYAGLSTELFMSGHFYWDVYADEPDILAKAVAVHGNFLKGHDEKKQRFIDSGMWLV